MLFSLLQMEPTNRKGVTAGQVQTGKLFHKVCYIRSSAPKTEVTYIYDIEKA